MVFQYTSHDSETFAQKLVFVSQTDTKVCDGIPDSSAAISGPYTCEVDGSSG